MVKSKVKRWLRGEYSLEDYLNNGMTVGKNFQPQKGCSFDYGHCWLISIGDNVTLAPRCILLAHDASTRQMLGYTKIGRVVIGSDVFIGADSVVLPGCRIGDRVIIGSNSVVTKDLESNGVYAGAPARYLCSFDEYRSRQQEKMLPGKNVFDESYTLGGGITREQKQEMIHTLDIYKIGFVK